MRVLIDGNFFENQPSQTVPIYLDIQLSDGGDWTKGVKVMVDSGNTGSTLLVLPENLIHELKLKLPIIAGQDAELADSSVEYEAVSLVNVMFSSIPTRATITLLEVPCAINKDADEGLIAIPYFLNARISEGKLDLLEFNPKAAQTHFLEKLAR